MSALELMDSKNQNEKHPIEYPDIIIEKILHQLGTNQKPLVNVTQLSNTLGYSQVALKAAVSILKNQYTHFVSENVLALRPKIDIAFDAIRQNINSFESSLNPSVCIGDFGVLDVQNAVQIFIDLCVSSNFEDSIDAKKFSRESIASATYCLSSAIKAFIMSTSSVQKEFASNKIMISGVEAIVGSVLSIIDIVLHGLKEMKGHEQVFDNQNTIILTSAIGKLIDQRVHLTNLEEDLTTSFTVIANTTKMSMENLPFIMDANIAILLKYITTPQEYIAAFNSTVGPIKILQSHLRELSHLAHVIYKNDDLTAYSVDTSSQNLIATIAYLTNNVADLPLELTLIREFHELIEPKFQANLLFIASNIKTLSDEITLIVERRLIDMICSSSSMDKTILQKLSIELQSSIEAMILTYEKVVWSSIETVRNHMYSVFIIIELDGIPEYDTEAQTLFSDTKQLIGELDRILSSKISTNSSTNDNLFTICAEAFDEAAQSPKRLRDFLRKSIEQINRYLL